MDKTMESKWDSVKDQADDYANIAEDKARLAEDQVNSHIEDADRSMGDDIHHAANVAKEKATEMGNTIKEKTQEAAHTVQEKAQQFKDRMSE